MLRKRKSGAIISVLVTASLLAAGCSGKEGDSGSTTSPASSAAAASSKPAEKANLSLWIPLPADFKGKDYNEKYSFQEMEKRTNVHINFQHVSDADVENQFNLLMSSGKLPDMIYAYEWDVQASKYGNNGALLPLETLIDKSAPNLKKVLADHPEIKGQITSPEGHIYYIPNMALDNTQLVQMFPQIREDWLNKLSVKAPETTDEWYNVLKQFAEKDPNGNGQKDEIPYISFGLDGLMTTFAPAFGIDYNFFVDNGKVQYGPYDSRFKDLLTYLNKLYSEKLIDITAKDYPELRERVISDKAGSWIGWAGSYMGTFTNLMKEKNHPTFKITPALPPKGPKGDQRHISNRWPASAFGIAVSSQTKNAEAIIKWLDYQFSPEGIILNNFGVEGKSYTLKDGKPAYTEEVLHPTGGVTNTQALLVHTIGGGSWPTVVDVDGGAQIRKANGQTENPTDRYAKFIDLKKKIPPLQFTKDESNVISQSMTDIKSFTEEKTTAFITGKLPISQFDQYVADMKKMKIDQVLEQYQKAYTRFSGK